MRLTHAFCVHLHTPGPNTSPTAHDPQHNAIPHPAEYVCPTRPFCFYLGRQIFTHAAFYNQSFRIVTGTSPSLSPNSWGHAGLGLGLGGWQRFLSAHAISALPCLAVGHVACSLVIPVGFYRSPLKIFIRLSPPCSQKPYLGSSTCSMAKSSERSRSSVTSSAHILSGISVVHCFVHKLRHISAVGILMSKCNLNS